MLLFNVSFVKVLIGFVDKIELDVEGCVLVMFYKWGCLFFVIEIIVLLFVENVVLIIVVWCVWRIIEFEDFVEWMF